MATKNPTFSRPWRSGTDHFPDVHVLAVDDSIIDRKVIERLLKITSCKVTAVESGSRALQYLGLDQEKSSPDFVDVDLIITDYCMPGMTGYELLKKIKGSANFREVPVVIMSSENVVARIDRCLEEGAEDFIVKPVKLSDVKRLKDYMFGPATTIHEDNNKFNNINKQDKGSFNKRKLQQMSEISPSNSPSPSPPTTSPSPPTSASPSPPTSASPSPPRVSCLSSPSPPTSASTSPPRVSCLSSPSPLSPSASPSTPPFSPSQLDSPTMRLKVTNSDEA
ncbi:hypothetical protein QVD17_31486 [Tagetes erecta]|uniref:Response regulatory domain-containing protein n=1 Tax=Tagetes erecta TaxID=13708 RepID=A0AAD8K6B7_TARER|nr:hypothetical protein QVD17_31486 [Tagetes erecta]